MSNNKGNEFKKDLPEDSKEDRKQDRSSKSRSRRKPKRNNGGEIRNDPNWYFTDEALMRQLTTYSFNQFVGEPVYLNDEVFLNASIAVNRLAPSIGGNVDNAANGVNLAAFRLYTELSANNAKTTNYAPQDLTTLILALGSLKALVSHVKRAFKVAKVYNERNRIVPRGLIEAMGIKSDDFFANLGNYRTELNVILSSMNTIPFPANIPYFSKCERMFEDIYLDDPSPMAQIILNVPAYIWSFNEQYNEDGTGLDTNPLEYANMSDWLFAITQLRDQLLQSSTLNYIYSDILRLATKGTMELGKFELLAEDEIVLPMFNELFINMWHNAKIVGHPVDSELLMGNASYTPNLDVVPDANRNIVRFRPVFNKAPIGEVILDFPTDTPDEAYLVDCTKFAVCGGTRVMFTDGDETTGLFSTDLVLPDWFITEIGFYGADIHGDYGELFKLDESNVYDIDVPKLCTLTRFNRHPMIYYRVTIVEGQSPQLFGDLNFFTINSVEYMSKLNDASFIGLMSLR